MCNARTLTVWLSRMTFVVMENQQAILCIAEFHVTANNIKISTVA